MSTQERPAVRIVDGSGGEWMIHWPDGKVEFFGFWELVRLFWWMVKNKRRAIHVGLDGKETLL